MDNNNNEDDDIYEADGEEEDAEQRESLEGVRESIQEIYSDRG